jgi:hypothetical protein
MVEESRDPTPAEMLLAMIAGKARTRTIAATRPVLARVPEHLLCYIDALAEMAGKSRSSMVVYLLDMAVQEAARSATPPEWDPVQAAAMVHMQGFQTATADRESGEV